MRLTNLEWVRDAACGHAASMVRARSSADSAAAAAEAAASGSEPAGCASLASKNAEAHATRTDAEYAVRALLKRCEVFPWRADQSSRPKGLPAQMARRPEGSSGIGATPASGAVGLVSVR
jgi:hypothetical protein